MLFSEAQLAQWLSDFLWPFFRIAGMLLAAPIFGIRQVPARFRVVLAVMIAVAVQPVIPPTPTVSALSAEAFLITFQQLAIGAAMGFMLQMAFNALIIGGQIMAYKMGLGFATMMDPANGVQVPVIAQYWLFIAMIAFVIANGHLTLIEGIAESFQVIPVAVDGITRNSIWTLIGWASRMFAAGLIMALPVTIALLVVNIALGVVSRAAPQLNIFAIGFPITMLMGFLMMWVTVPQVLTSFGALVIEAFQHFAEILTTR